MSFKMWTDGACRPNSGPGGWGFVIIEDARPDEHYDRHSGGEVETTNNRMEITAVIKGLEVLPEDSYVEVISDSRLVVNAMNLHWKRNKNKDLWALLDALVDKREVYFTWIKGHAGDEMNELADRLAVEGIPNLLSGIDLARKAGVRSLIGQKHGR